MGQKYLTFGDIQNHIINHYNSKKMGLDFRTAFENLIASDKLKTGTPEMPDFLGWNKKDVIDLVLLAYLVPITCSEMKQVIPSYFINSNTTTLPTVAEVQINFETAYSPEQFTAIDYYIVLYVLEGKTIVYFPNKTQTLNVGELIILPPGTPHRSFHGPSDHVLNIMSAKNHFEANFFQLFKTENILSTFFRHTLFSSSNEYLMFQLPVSVNILNLIAHLFSEYTLGATYSSPVFNNFLQIFYFYILRNSSSSLDSFQNKDERIPKVIIPTIIQHLQENYRTLTLESLAESFHYDSAYLSKIIKKYTSKNFTQLITELKIAEAKKLLLETPLKVEEISDMVGYNSSDYFTHKFTQVNKISPTQYRYKKQ